MWPVLHINAFAFKWSLQLLCTFSARKSKSKHKINYRGILETGSTEENSVTNKVKIQSVTKIFRHFREWWSRVPIIQILLLLMCKRHRQYKWLICTESLLCARKLFIPCNNILRQVLLFSSFYASGNWGSETWSNLPRVTQQGSAPKPNRRHCLDVIHSTPWCFVGSELDASGPNEGPDQLGRPVSTCFPPPLGSPGPQRDFSDDLSLQFGNWWPWQQLSLHQLSRQRVLGVALGTRCQDQVCLHASALWEGLPASVVALP